MTTDELLDFHKKLSDTSHTTLRQKSHDFTSGSQNPFRCLDHTARAMDTTTNKLILARMYETVMRLKTFADKGIHKVPNSSVENACADLMNWCVLFAANNEVNPHSPSCMP